MTVPLSASLLQISARLRPTVLWRTGFMRTRVTKWMICLWLGFMPLSLSGCYDRKELEQQAFVTVLGLDNGPGGTIDCTFELASPQSPDGGSASSATKSPNRVVVRAHSLAEALTVANASVERSLSFTHLTMIVFGQSLAQNGLGNLLQSLIRFREFRGTILLTLAKGKAQDLMQSFTPMLEKSPSRAAESVALVGQDLGIIPVTYLHDFTRELQTSNVDGLVPLFAINQAVKSDPKGQNPISPDVEPHLAAGTLPRSGGNPVEWSGSGVFRDDKLVDFLDGEQTRDVEMLRGKVRRTLITFIDPLDKQAHVGLALHAEDKPVYHVTLGKPVRIDITVPLEADIENTESSTDYTQPKMRAKLEQSVGQQLDSELKTVLTRLLVEDAVDPVPISDHIRAQFTTDQQFTAYPWMQQVKQASIVIHTKLHIRRFGIQTIPLKKGT